MRTPQEALTQFVEQAEGFDPQHKLKLIVFSADKKKATYVRLKIGTNNLDEKHHFENHLKQCNFTYLVSKPKTYEEIKTIKKNTVIWQSAGIWFGYDLFQNKKLLQQFKTYKTLLKKQQHKKADALGAALYGYPSCCQKEYGKQHDIDYTKKKYTYYQYYKKIHDTEQKFPFIFHTPCSTKCRRTEKLNRTYKKTVHHEAPHFYKNYTKKRQFTATLVSDTYSDILDNKNNSIWTHKNAYEHAMLTLKPINKHHYLLSYLSKKELPLGSTYSARITTSCETATIKLDKKKRTIKNFHHERIYHHP